MKLIKNTLSSFVEHDCMTMAAGMAYYTVFALPPLLYLLLLIVSAGFSVALSDQASDRRAEDLIETQAEQLIGNQAAASEIDAIIEQLNVNEGPWWRTPLSAAGVLIGATGVFAAVQSSLNRIWDAKPDPNRAGWRRWFRKRLLSLGLICGIAFVLLVSMLLSVLLAATGQSIGEWLGVQVGILSSINQVVSFLITIAVFSMMFRYMPDADIAWAHALIGGCVTSILFVAGRYALSYYLQIAEPTAGLSSAAGSLAVLLIWIYYSTIVFFLGAEATRAWAMDERET